LRDGRHILPVRVYYEDTDFSGVVYHASYLRFMERGRTEYLRRLGIDHRAMFERQQAGVAGVAFAVRSMQIEFIRPAYMDDVLTITTAPQQVRGASLILQQRVLRGSETLVAATVRCAVVSAGKAQRLPEELRLALEADQAALAASSD
jgi:acyl-CoA thioester hydrolase